MGNIQIFLSGKKLITVNILNGNQVIGMLNTRKNVSIKIDRPFGSKHPVHSFLYPVNYGFVPNTTAPDGDGIDAYVLGLFEPVREFSGKCIAIIHRLDDNDDKLVIVPEGKCYSNDQILALTEFQERFFNSEIIR